MQSRACGMVTPSQNSDAYSILQLQYLQDSSALYSVRSTIVPSLIIYPSPSLHGNPVPFRFSSSTMT